MSTNYRGILNKNKFFFIQYLQNITKAFTTGRQKRGALTVYLEIDLLFPVALAEYIPAIGPLEVLGNKSKEGTSHTQWWSQQVAIPSMQPIL